MISRKKESNEPLVQLYRELPKVIDNFILEKRRNRIIWHEVEPIYNYYKKYISGRVSNPFDFEGEVFDYLHRNGEATTKMLLQSLRNEIMRAIAYYDRWSEFYNQYSHKDLLNMALLYHQKKITTSSSIIQNNIGNIDFSFSGFVFDKDRIPSVNFKNFCNTLQKSQWNLSTIDEYYNSMMDSIKKIEEFASTAEWVLFDFEFFIFGLQNHVGVINKLIGNPAPEMNFYPIESDDSINDNASEPAVCFSKELLTSIYNLCNGNQFDSVKFDDFSADFNLQKTDTCLVVRKKEKQRVYYLLYRLCELLEEDQQDFWIDKMLDKLKLDKNSYSKKYKEVESVSQKDNSSDYVYSLKRIIINHKA